MQDKKYIFSHVKETAILAPTIEEAKRLANNGGGHTISEETEVREATAKEIQARGAASWKSASAAPAALPREPMLGDLVSVDGDLPPENYTVDRIDAKTGVCNLSRPFGTKGKTLRNIDKAKLRKPVLGL